MDEKKRDFDSEAATWDNNPTRIRIVEQVLDAIVRRIVLTTDMEVLDFGCGTGLLSIRLLPFVQSIIGVDSSAGMIDVFKRKITTEGLNGIAARLIDFDKGDRLTGNYDLVTSNMTMHHIRDLKHLFSQFYSILKPGGYLCISDLDSDEGKFHSNNSGVFHFGFERHSLQKLLEETGFGTITFDTATEVTKPDVDGISRHFTIFCATSRKP